MLFAKRVEQVTGGAIRLLIKEPGTLVSNDAIFDAVNRGSKHGGIDAAIVAPSQNRLKVKNRFVALPFTRIYFSGVPFGPEAEEFLSWMYYAGGLELENELYNKVLSGGDGVVAFPMGINHGEGVGMTPTLIPSTVEELAATPWNLRILGLAGTVIQRVIQSVSDDPALTIHSGTVGVPVYQDLKNGTLQAAEFSSPAQDIYEFFDLPSSNGEPAVSQFSSSNSQADAPLLFYYVGAWHQPFALSEFLINKQVYDSLGSTAQAQLENAARAHVLSELVRTQKASGRALRRMQNVYGVTIVNGWPQPVLDALRAATIDVINEEAQDPDFNTVLTSLRKFTRTQQFYWKYDNVDPAKRFDTEDSSNWPGWGSQIP
ncbi:hypothetical protein L0156_18240 [bacterium]|nr:hypothetical protein [bacterium]